MMKRTSLALAGASAAALVVGLAAAPAAVAAPERATYIVTVAKGSERSIEARAKALGGSIEFRYETALNGFAVELPVAAAAGLGRSAGVLAMEADAEVSIDATQSGATWGLDRIDQATLPLSGTYTYGDTAGGGVRSYIIDTGIRSTHVDFGSRVAKALGYSAVKDKYGTEDCNGHGTHVAGTVGGTTYGVAKLTTLIPVRVLNCRGSGTNSGVIAGIDFVASAKAANANTAFVANMSLGGGLSQAVNDAVARATTVGVVMVVAAGNSTANACNYSPASAPSAITVAASTSTDAQASYSNFGGCVDLYAPGSSITSAWFKSNTATNTISGTSMASPHVAGAAALYLGLNPSATPATVAGAIAAAAAPGKITNATTGTPNKLLQTITLA